MRVVDLTIEVRESPIIEHFNLVVERGQLIELLGGNGSGKTTLLRHLIGVRQPARGVIDSVGSKVGYVGQKSGLDELLTVRENLNWLMHVIGESPKTEDPYDVLDAFSLTDFENERVGSLSTGQHKRCSLARLMLMSADLWLLDEPLASLDASGCDLVRSLLTNHIQDGGSAVVATHVSLGLESTDSVSL